MQIRQDLMDLGSEALTAMANAGFVKRAQKDAAAGTFPAVTQNEDGTVIAEFDDGTRTSIGPAHSLRDADCTCIASGMCRHRVMLVLAYQAKFQGQEQQQASAPAAQNGASGEAFATIQFDDAAVAACVHTSVLEQASQLAITKPIATVIAHPSVGDASVIPTVQLPMNNVRFFSTSNLAHARCDCKLGSACEHVVLAVWAFRVAHQLHANKTEAIVEIPPFGKLETTAVTPALLGESERVLMQEIDLWLWSLWRDGSAQSLQGLQARYVAIQVGVQDRGWTWADVALDRIWQMLQAQARRSSRFDALELAVTIAQLWMRLHAAESGDGNSDARIPIGQILGIGQNGEVALDLLRLTSLGIEFWRDDDNEGASLVLADPDTQSMTVLERSWPLEAQDNWKPESLQERRVAGQSLKQLARGQIITRAATRHANARLELAATAKHTSVLPLSPKSWDDLTAPLKFSSTAALMQYLKNRPPAAVRPLQAGGNWQVLDLSAAILNRWSWDAPRQTVHAIWHGQDGAQFRTYLAHQALTPGAVDAFARALHGEWGRILHIAGPTWLERNAVAMNPMSLLTEQRAIVLAIEPKAPQAMQLAEHSLVKDPGEFLLQESQQLLAQVLRQGIRHASGSLRTRVTAQAKALTDAGYSRCGELMTQVFSHGDAIGKTGQLIHLCGQVLLLQALTVR